MKSVLLLFYGSVNELLLATDHNCHPVSNGQVCCKKKSLKPDASSRATPHTPPPPYMEF